MITRKTKKVNSDIFKKYKDYKIMSLDISEKMLRTDVFKLNNRGIKMKFCATEMDMAKCKCGNIEIVRTNLCRDRLCPVCNWRLSLYRYAKMMKIMNELKKENYQYTFLSLTIKNCYTNKLSETIKSMMNAWKKMVKRKLMKAHVVGWARSLEVTYNKKANTFHPHFHIILAWEEDFKVTGLTRQIQQTWKEVMNIKYSPQIHHVPIEELKEEIIFDDVESEVGFKEINKAVLETFKYSTKINDLRDMPMRAFEDIALQLSGVRLVAFGGIIKEINKLIESEEEIKNDNAEKDTETINCSKCSRILQLNLLRWSFDKNTYENIGVIINDNNKKLQS